MYKQPTKLTEAKVQELIFDYNNGNGPNNLILASKYNVSQTTIRNTLIREKVYKITRGTCTVPPSPFEAKKIREHNRLMKATLKSIVKCIEQGATPKYIKVLAAAAVQKCDKKTGIKSLTENQITC